MIEGFAIGVVLGILIGLMFAFLTWAVAQRTRE